MTEQEDTEAADVPPVDELLTDPVEEVESSADEEEVVWPVESEEPAEEPGESLANDGTPGAKEE